MTVITILVIGGLIFGIWLGEKNTKVIVNILDSIPDIDSIMVKEGETKENILAFTNVDPSFSNMVDGFNRII